MLQAPSREKVLTEVILHQWGPCVMLVGHVFQPLLVLRFPPETWQQQQQQQHVLHVLIHVRVEMIGNIGQIAICTVARLV